MYLLATRSGALARRSGALGVRGVWFQCTEQYLSMISGSSYTAGGAFSPFWPYPSTEISNAMNTCWGSSPTVTSGTCSAYILAGHSHGCTWGNVSGHEAHDMSENISHHSYGNIQFMRTSSMPSTVTAGRLRIWNCGRVQYTVNHGDYPYWADHWVSCGGYPGYIAAVGDADLYLSLFFYIDNYIYYEMQIPIATIRTLNGSNGVVSSGLLVGSYMMNGYIDVYLSSTVLSMLNSYNGINLLMSWNWSSGILGGYCARCMLDYDQATGASYSEQNYRRIAACAVTSTGTILANSPHLYLM